MLDALSPQRRRLVLGVAGLLLLLVSALVITIAVRALAPAPDPVPQDQPGPVLLVPGYGGRIQSLDTLAAALRASGRTAIVVQPVAGNTGDPRIEAEHLAEVAEQALDAERRRST
jgi:hypothetical protein